MRTLFIGLCSLALGLASLSLHAESGADALGIDGAEGFLPRARELREGAPLHPPIFFLARA